MEKGGWPWRDKRSWTGPEVRSPVRGTKGKGFQLKDFDPGDTRGLKLDKGEAAELLQRGTEWLAEEQDMLYAQNRWSLLLVFQAMDAAGKDSTIKHVMSGVNPQGSQVVSFKQPTSEDLDHDFMWRYMRRLPERGRIGIFNRSYYEEVLVVRVHEEILKRQQLPPELVGKKIWDERFADITHFEDYLTRQGTIVLKFFLNLSREEQKSPDLSSRVGPGLRRRRRRPGTGWLVALVGVRVSLFSYALPMIFVGALVKLLGNGRIAAPRGPRSPA